MTQLGDSLSEGGAQKIEGKRLGLGSIVDGINKRRASGVKCMCSWTGGKDSSLEESRVLLDMSFFIKGHLRKYGAQIVEAG